MKKVYIETIEYRKAWWPKYRCRCCKSRKYELHHVIDEGWYCKCSECGRLTAEMDTRKGALWAWRGIR